VSSGHRRGRANVDNRRDVRHLLLVIEILQPLVSQADDRRDRLTARRRQQPLLESLYHRITCETVALARQRNRTLTPAATIDGSSQMFAVTGTLPVRLPCASTASHACLKSTKNARLPATGRSTPPWRANPQLFSTMRSDTARS